MLKRYAFMDRPEKLHYFYQGSWIEGIPTHFTDEYNKLVELWVAKGYHPDIAKLDAKGCVPLLDPGLAQYNETYAAVAKGKKTKEVELLERMTIPGVMLSIIELAKVSKKRHLPRSKMSAWKNTFLRPTSEWYHPVFAKDLYKIKPEWCEYELTDDEQKEFLAYMLKKNKKPPVGRDPWIIPVSSPWAKFKGSLRPLASRAYKKHGDNKIYFELIKQKCQKGERIDDQLYKWAKGNFPTEFEQLKADYPEVLDQQKWLKNNLTPVQQQKVDKWKQVVDLVVNDKDDYILIKDMTKEERSLVGNHLKMLDQSFAFQPQKMIDTLKPMIDDIKKARPALYHRYCKERTKWENGGGKLVDWLRDHENKQAQEEILQMARNGAPWPYGDKTLRGKIKSFTRKSTKYPEFAEELKTLRPDWFDKKWHSQMARKRHFAKKKEMMNEQ